MKSNEEEAKSSAPKRKKRGISFLDENNEIKGDPPSQGDPGSILENNSNERGQDSFSGSPTTDDQSAHAESPGEGVDDEWCQPAEVRHPTLAYTHP